MEKQKKAEWEMNYEEWSKTKLNIMLSFRELNALMNSAELHLIHNYTCECEEARELRELLKKLEKVKSFKFKT